METMYSAVYDDCSRELQLPIRDVPGSESWTSVKTIQHGDSTDRKFKVKDQNGNRYMIRLLDKTRYDHGKFACRLMDMLYQNKVPVPCPASFGVCDQNRSVYLMTHWIYGKPAPERLPEHHETVQYLLGQETAVYLHALHGCEAPTGPDLWAQKICQQIDQVQATCSDADKDLSCVNSLLQFVLDNAHIVGQQPQRVLHGDLTPANLIFSYETSVSLIDFEKWQFGDPLADLTPIMTDFSHISSRFATGFLDCYFHYQTDVRTFRCLAFYAALRRLQQYAAACAAGEMARQLAIQDVRQLVKDYSGFSTVVPVWYRVMPQMKEQTKNRNGRKSKKSLDDMRRSEPGQVPGQLAGQC
ncbi:MAG: phosphotransferase [Bacillota bacterium]|nr:phosphotransferase [Bacillota bacterium]